MVMPKLGHARGDAWAQIEETIHVSSENDDDGHIIPYAKHLQH